MCCSSPKSAHGLAAMQLNYMLYVKKGSEVTICQQ